MEYVIRETNKVVTYPGLKDEFPSVYIPPVPSTEYLNDLGVDEVFETIPPNTDHLSKYVRDGVEKVDGVWVEKYKQIPKMVAKEELYQIVAQRRKDLQNAGLLYEFPDTPGTIQTRDEQDLTNITAQTVAGLILSLQGVTDPVLSFTDEANVTHPMTPTEIIAMGMAVSLFVNITYKNKWTHDKAIEAWDMNSPYDYNAGWE